MAKRVPFSEWIDEPVARVPWYKNQEASDLSDAFPTGDADWYNWLDEKHPAPAGMPYSPEEAAAIPDNKFTRFASRQWKRGVGWYRGLNPVVRYSLATAAGLGVGAGLFYSLFSGRDDSYNTIEGLKHRGLAVQSRKVLSDFGSGYQGPVVSGQIISPTVSAFREKWYQNEQTRAELEARVKASQTAYDDLGASELTQVGPGVAEVDISAYRPVWEDADTLLLRSPAWKFWKDDVAIRLTGIDAPEIAHPGDPTEWFRYHQAQPHGELSKQQVEELTANQQLRVLIASDPGQRTYNRYLGLIYREGNPDTPINLELVQQGIAAALPFGESGSDIYPRSKFMRAERQAISQEKGIWSEPFFQRYLEVSKGLGGRITFNTFTDLTRLAKNYHLAAAESFLSRPDPVDPRMGRWLGQRLIPSYGRFFSAKDDNYNTIEGLPHGGMAEKSRHIHSDFGSGWVGDVARATLLSSDDIAYYLWLRPKVVKRKRKQHQQDPQIPGRDDAYNTIEGLPHGGLAEKLRKVLTDFGSGWDPLRALAKDLGMSFEELTASKGFQEALSRGITTGKFLGEGAFAKTYLHTTRYAGHEISFVRKQLRPEALESYEAFKANPLGEDVADPLRIAEGIQMQLGLDLEREASIMNELATASVPSVYSYNKEQILMEFMEGKTAKGFSGRITHQHLDEILETQRLAVEKGILNTDIHANNIILGEHAAWIDWGLARRTSELTPFEIDSRLGNIEHMIRSHIRPGLHVVVPSVINKPQTLFTSNNKQNIPIAFDNTAEQTSRPAKTPSINQTAHVLRQAQMEIANSVGSAGKGHERRQPTMLSKSLGYLRFMGHFTR